MEMGFDRLYEPRTLEDQIFTRRLEGCEYSFSGLYRIFPGRSGEFTGQIEHH